MNEHRGLWHGKHKIYHDFESEQDVFEWVEGYYVANGEDLHYIITDKFEQYLIDPSTLGECTGLRDKNGKLIFEGDIVEYSNVNYEIKYIEGFATFSLRSVDNMNYAPCITTNIIPRMSVIGNIHDNPELLQKGAAE